MQSKATMRRHPTLPKRPEPRTTRHWVLGGEAERCALLDGQWRSKLHRCFRRCLHRFCSCWFLQKQTYSHYPSQQSHSSCVPRGAEGILTQNLHPDVYSCFIHSCQSMKVTKVSLSCGDGVSEYTVFSFYLCII